MKKTKMFKGLQKLFCEFNWKATVLLMFVFFTCSNSFSKTLGFKNDNVIFKNKGFISKCVLDIVLIEQNDQQQDTIKQGVPNDVYQDANEDISSSQQLEDVVVVGYGTQKKANLTGAIGSISQKALENRPITNVTNALQGTMAGVTVTTTNGQPGKDAGSIKIRGIGTLNNSNPLVIVDGVIGSMGEVNPSDIENITVLKDAASASIYGSRAANGVILITTKKGKKGKLQVRYENNTGVTTLGPLPDFLPSWDQASLYNEAMRNEGKPLRWTNEEIQKFRDGTDPMYPNTDWVGLFYKKTALQVNHYLSVSGGDEKSVYGFSLGYFDQDGNVQGTTNKRYTTRFNINSQIRDKLSLYGSVSYQQSPITEPVSTYSPSFGQMIRMINRISNVVPYKYPNGYYGYISDGSPMAWLESGSSNEITSNVLTGNFGGSWEFVKGLTFKPSIMARINTSDRSQFVEDIQYYSGETGLPTTWEGPNNLIKSSDKTTYTNAQALLEYKLNVADVHQFALLGGATAEYSLYQYLYAYRQNFLNNSIKEIDAGPKNGQQNEGYSNEIALQSYFGRLNYDYDGKYLFEANYRYDGSSRFTPENRWASFSSFSAGWNIDREAFYDPIKKVVNTFKLRASWGQLGNQNTPGDTNDHQNSGNYPSKTSISSGTNYSFNQGLASGISPKIGANKDIKWETTTSNDIGFDATFLQNKLSFTVDYFIKNTDDILMKLPLGGVYGLDPPYQNAGSVSNKGWEFSGGYKTKVGQFGINVSANTTFIKTEITDLKGAGPIIDGNTLKKEGYPINSLYGFVAEGIFQSQAEIDSWATQDLGGPTAPGDLKYKDISGPNGVPDGKIDATYDRTYLGTYFPEVTYAFNIGVTWKHFELTTFFQGVSGITVDGGTLIGKVGPDVEKPTSAFLDRWTPETPNAAFPRTWYNNKQNDFLTTPSSFWMKDASYLRLKNLTVAYNIPESLLSKIGISTFKIYYSGQNLLTFTDFYSWIDPEVGSAGSLYSYPQTVVNSVGINLTF